ncbi:GTP 3',8-cyclase MoaA [Agathobaculum sp.]|uniref:GTP 3',8-cyclase MoaA n=1 Tax=Agathobaculum sp. TaxID=2048138 RepID=UPI003AF066C0
MKDRYGRTIKYLRLSVTDLCNCRCVYCMGENGVPRLPHSAILSFEEIEEIVRAAVSLGVTKVRLTGGEPLVRRGIDELVRRLRGIEGVEELAMTTNGARLAEYAARLKSAGLDRLNVSLDTLNPEKFRRITRIGELRDTLDGLDAARRAGFERIKLNTVLMGGVNDDEIAEIAALAKDGAFDVRFIELMPIGECTDWDRRRFLPAERVLEYLPKGERVPSDGVAELWRPAGFRGTVGLIRPLSHRFCADCDRIRVTADGCLKPCLHSAREIPLRGKHGETLVRTIAEGMQTKPREHHMADGHASESRRGMNRIGG